MRCTATDAAIRFRSSTWFSSRSVNPWHEFGALRSGFRAEDNGCVAEEGGSCLKRIDVEGLSPSQVQEQVDFHTPCILTGALELTTSEAWCDALMESLGDSQVEYQIRDNDSGHSEMFQSTLAGFIYDLQGESTHDHSWYLLDEHLLDDPRVSPAIEPTFQGLQQLLGRDEFELFPPSVRPQKSCLIVGGIGARSFLHGDPMEWLGWNVLLEGRKLWTFLPPSPELDAQLGTYRLAPNAFGEHNISAGWQSDVDLFRRRTSASWPLAREEQEIWRLTTSGVQEPGDIVIIPPRYWHQVYHLEPSVAVASQHMNHHVRKGVFRHILDWCGAREGALPIDFDQLTLPQQVRHVLRAALVAQLGQERGLEAFANLDPPR